MKYGDGVLALVVVSMALAGCARVTTQVVEKPRVDQELGQQGGNRGYLVGTPPQAGERKGTRSILETNIELPTGSEMNPWKRKAAPAPAPQAPEPVRRSTPAYQPPPPVYEEEELEIEPIRPSAPAPRGEAGSQTYTVQSGDTLDKISMKVYGTSTKWRQIYEANQDTLKSPNRIYPGQKLVIPQAGPGGSRAESSSEDSDLK